jgi:hypothetical protein
LRTVAAIGLPALTACQSAAAAPRPDAPGFAVVELYTSEGCSSCPPADLVLNRVAAEARRLGQRVVPLAFHVDYWDDLGWPDRFSSARFTDRQRAYSRAFGESELYTPEMIVNGGAHFIGSDAASADRNVRDALARRPALRLASQVRRLAPDRVALHAGVACDGGAPAPPSARVVVAVVQHAATVDVRGGENAGRTLRHVEVVRALADEPLGGGCAIDMTIPLPWAPGPGEAAVATLVQDDGPRSRAIVAAEVAELP